LGKNVAITGGAGMVGAHLVKLLQEQGAAVLALDNLERGKNIPREGFVKRDCTDLDALIRDFHKTDIVLNLAAKVTAIDYNSLHHGEMFHRNMLLQQIPLEAARLAGVKRFLQCSTVCVYGHNAPIPTPEDFADINMPEPTNEGYGLAKLMGEKMAQYYAKEYGMEIAITRFANAYGEMDYFDWETSHVIPALIRKNLERDVVDIWGDGEQRREFLYANDAAIGIMKVAELGTGQGPVNIGGGYNCSMNELNTMIQNVLGVTKRVTHSFEKPTGHRERLADNSKLWRICGWVPETTLDEGLRLSIRWYLDNQKPTSHLDKP
jgi:GDP-L-fucose synthase